MFLAPETCPILHEFSIVWLGVKQCAPHYQISRASVADCGLSIMSEGSGEVQIAGQWQRVDAGHAVIFPPGAWRSFRTLEQSWQYCSIVFRHRPDAAVPPGFETARILEADAQPIVSLARIMCRDWLASADHVLLRHLLEGLAQYVRRLIDPEHQGRSLLDVWAAVNNDLARPWNIQTLAEMAQMSVTALRRHCRRKLNCTPMDHVTKLRMGHAAALLGSDQANVSEAAAAVGYENTFAFSRAFKRVQGMSPKPFQLRQQGYVVPETSAKTAINLHQYRTAVRNTSSEVFPQAAGDSRKFLCVPMDPLLNRRLSGGTEAWLGADPLEHLSAGQRTYHGIPFMVRNKALVFASTRRNSLRELPMRIRIPCAKRVSAMYVLHACGWAGFGQSVGTWSMIFSGGTFTSTSIETFSPDSPKGNIADWWPNQPPGRSEDALPVIVNSSDPRDTYERHLYVAQWRNHRADEAVEAIEISVPANAGSVYAILAVTLNLA